MSLKAGLLVGHLGSSESCPEVTPVSVGYVIWALVWLDSETLARSEILRTLDQVLFSISLFFLPISGPPSLSTLCPSC